VRQVDVGYARVAVHEWGDEAGVPIVFWHALGRGTSGADVGTIAPALTNAGFRVIGIDGPGFGRSSRLPADRYELDALVELLRDVVDELELVRLVAMGHSWGGAVAVAYAATHPGDVCGLVLLDSGHIDYADLRATVTGDGVQDWARRGMLQRLSPRWPVLDEHGIPTLLLLATAPPHGDQNRAHVARFEQAVPGAEVRWVDGAGHGLLDDAGDRLGDEIADWLVEQGI
jgi:pimeloyl-ACP methyl ester carboxylesterase